MQPVDLHSIAKPAKEGDQRSEACHQTLEKRRGKLAAVEF
jgi:cell division protein FtsL